MGKLSRPPSPPPCLHFEGRLGSHGRVAHQLKNLVSGPYALTAHHHDRCYPATGVAAGGRRSEVYQPRTYESSYIRGPSRSLPPTFEACKCARVMSKYLDL